MQRKFIQQMKRAARWYKTTVTSTKKQKKLKITTAADQGGFKFTIYQSGKKKSNQDSKDFCETFE